MVEYLKALFTCDGGVENWDSTKETEADISIHYYTTSHRLAEGVYHLLLRLGITSHIQYSVKKLYGRGFDLWQVIIGNKEGIGKFRDKIGFIGEKADKLETAWIAIKDRPNHPHNDTIPIEIWEYVKGKLKNHRWDTTKEKGWIDIGRALGYKKPKGAHNTIKFAPGREKLGVIADVLDDDWLHYLAESDLLWDEIKSIEDDGVAAVYDLVVPSVSNFVAQDIITHNTTAAIVIAEHIQRKKGGSTMIYFPGYPQNYAPPHIVALPISAIPQLMDSVEPGAIVIFDDAYRFFSSYRTQSNTGLMFQDWVNGIAHQGVTIILTVQDSSDLHKAGLRADAFVFKPPERMFEGSERPQMRPIVKRVSQSFDSIPKADWVKHMFVYADPERQAMLTYERPPWMTRSKAKYRGSQRGHAFSNSEQGVGKSPVTGSKKTQYNPFDSDA